MSSARNIKLFVAQTSTCAHTYACLTMNTTATAAMKTSCTKTCGLRGHRPTDVKSAMMHVRSPHASSQRHTRELLHNHCHPGRKTLFPHRTKRWCPVIALARVFVVAAVTAQVLPCTTTEQAYRRSRPPTLLKLPRIRSFPPARRKSSKILCRQAGTVLVHSVVAHTRKCTAPASRRGPGNT